MSRSSILFKNLMNTKDKHLVAPQLNIKALSTFDRCSSLTDNVNCISDSLASCRDEARAVLLGEEFKSTIIKCNSDNILLPTLPKICDEPCSSENKYTSEKASTSVCRSLFGEGDHHKKKKMNLVIETSQSQREMTTWLETRLKVYQDHWALAQKNGSKSTMKRKARRIFLYKKMIEDVRLGKAVNISQLPDPLSSHFGIYNRGDEKETQDANNVLPSKMKENINCPKRETQLVGRVSKELETETESQVKLPRSNEGKKPPRKENYCIECKKTIKEFCKHYENVHRYTSEGRQLNELNKIKDITLRKKLKMKITDNLRKIGNAELSKANAKESFFKGGDAEVVPVKRSFKENANQLNTVQCSHCEGFYRRRKFSQHLRRCPKLSTSTEEIVELEGNVDALKKHALPILQSVEGASQELMREVIQIMKPRTAKDVALRDPLIMKYASEFHKTRRASFQHVYVSRVIIDLAKIVMRMQEIEGEKIHCLEDVLNPAYFNSLVRCILQEGGYDLEAGTVEKCGLNNRLRSHIKGAAQTAKKEAFAEEYMEYSGSSSKIPTQNIVSRRKKLKHFLKVLDEKWANEIGRIFDMAAKQSRSEREPKLAAEEDIIKTCQYVSSQYKIIIKELDDTPRGTPEKQNKYNVLLDMLITHIMCLIRRRPVDFKRGQNVHFERLEKQDDLICEIKNSKNMKLSDDDLKLCNKFTIFYVPGKGWKEMVPIALTRHMKEAMDAIQRNKKFVGITSDNLFVRAKNRPINPRECLRKITKNLALRKPLDLSGNGLRHHAGTFSKLHSTHPQYQDYLASALGHTLHIHKLHYEMPTSITQKLIVCPVLYNMTKPLNKRQDISTPIHKKQVVDNLPVFTNSPQVDVNLLQELHETPEKDIWISKETNSDPNYEESDTSCSSTEINIPLKKRKILRKRWTEEEKMVIYQGFGDDILQCKQPSRSTVIDFFNTHRDTFKNRTIDTLVAFLHNKCLRKQKNVTPEVKKFLLNTHKRITNVPL